jgi:predicted Fe-S protein YdhL (DUF1289 family)
MDTDAHPFESYEASSPCIGVCQMIIGTQTCSGCFRTVDEIVNWPNMTADERIEVNKRLEAIK